MAVRKKKLPEIKILGVKDVTSAEVRLEVPDGVFAEIAAYGKEVITDKQYFEIGFCAMLEETLDTEINKLKKKKKPKKL
jgi:hypothetical protein